MSNFIPFHFLLVENWHERCSVFPNTFLWEPKAWWCIIFPEGLMARLHKANIVPPYVISPWQTETLSHLITKPAWHTQKVKHSWQCLSEGGKCTEFPEFLVKTVSTKKLVNTLLAQEETWVCTAGTPRGSASAPFFHPAALHPGLLMHWALHYKLRTQEQ